MKSAKPSIAELIAIVAEFNKARTNEIESLPTSVDMSKYKDPFMDSLYEVALAASNSLKQTVKPIPR